MATCDDHVRHGEMKTLARMTGNALAEILVPLLLGTGKG